MALAKYEVTGFFGIRDAVTKKSVPKGQIVTLDDEKTIISVLIESGAVQPVKEEPGADPSAD